MKLLFEEYEYQQKDVKGLLPGYLWTLGRGGKVKTTYVGYFFSQEINDSVFILPKVFLDQEGNAFKKKGQLPEDIIHADSDEHIDEADKEIMFSLSVWIFQAIRHYLERNPDSMIAEESEIENVIDIHGDESETLLETVLALKTYAKNHRTLFTYISHINHSGVNKIHWSKTISNVQPLIVDDAPYYLTFKNKDKAVNYDEEIIVLFYSVLAYINQKYRFRITIDVKYTLLPVYKIEGMIETGKGTRLLRSIRKKYFTDELVSLWKLLFVFFDKMERIVSNSYQEETLLVRSFNNVFEDMVDQMLGDPEVNEDLKNQQDGKIVDHIYPYQSLINDHEIYYIGDSKYYKAGTQLGKYSIFKQYTYAKNVVQYNIDLLNDDPAKLDNLYYRDTSTEGYNITPNFFIKGTIPEGYDFDLHLLNETEEDENRLPLRNFHFHNRLFDRDTYVLQTYNVNFLYVISSYVTGDDENTKNYIRRVFKDDLIRRFNQLYEFHLLKAKNGDLEAAITQSFRMLLGKVIRPANDRDSLVLALEIGEHPTSKKTKAEQQKENKELLAEVDKLYNRERFVLGDLTAEVEKKLDDISTTTLVSGADDNILSISQIKNLTSSDGYSAIQSTSTISVLSIADHLDDVFLVACYRDESQLAWIESNSKYFIHKQKSDTYLQARYLILHPKDDASQYMVFALLNPSEINRAQLAELGYTPHHSSYVIFDICKISFQQDVDLLSILGGKQINESHFLVGKEMISKSK